MSRISVLFWCLLVAVCPFLVRGAHAASAYTFLSPIPAQSATVGQPYTYTIPSEILDDEYVITIQGCYAWLLPDELELPSWLSVSSGGTFSGTPQVGDVGTLTIQVDVDSGIGRHYQTSFDLTVSEASGGSGSGSSGVITEHTRYRVRKYFGEGISRGSGGGTPDDDDDGGDDEENPDTVPGPMWGWGGNKWGVLSLGDTAGDYDGMGFAQSVLDPLAGAAFKQISAGDWQACGIDTNGKGWCWGANAFYSLGIGSDDEYDLRHVPAEIAGRHTFKSISIGGSFTGCGVDTSGVAWCWGSNSNGMMGIDDAGVDFSSSPVQVESGAVRFSSVAVLQNSVFALDTSGSLWTWGNGVYAPISVPGGHVFAKMEGAYEHACGIKADGSAWCWGVNTYGQLGDGTETDSDEPVAVLGGIAFHSVKPGSWFTCGVATDGNAWCWGHGGYGELGDDGSSNSSQPVAVAGGHAFSAVASGVGFSCALDAGGTAWCWGTRGLDGMSSTRSPEAVTMPAGKTFGMISAGGPVGNYPYMLALEGLP